MFKKVFLVLLGTVIALSAGEIFLRLAGSLYYKEWMREEARIIEDEKRELREIEERINALPEDTKLVRILCVGDSWTFGAGTSPGYSYPAQLQAILEKEDPSRYRVYNAGLPGCTSLELLKILPGFLQEYKPDRVVILVGVNDIFNPFVPEIILMQRYGRGPLFRISSAISDLRIYKVIRLSLAELRRKLTAAKRHRIDVIKSRESNAYARTGQDLFHSGKADLAREYFEKAINANPYNEKAYLHFGHLYLSLRQYDKALILYEWLLEVNPYTPLRPELYRFLFLMYQDRIYGDPFLRASKQKKINSLVRKIPSDRAFKNPGSPFVLNQELVLKNLEHNLNKIINLAESKGATPLIQTYLGGSLFIDDTLIDFSKKHNILLVINEKNIGGDYFAPDGHPNEKGYRLIAENIYKALKSMDKWKPRA